MKHALHAVSSHLGDLVQNEPEEKRRHEIIRWIDFVNALARAYKQQGESLFEAPDSPTTPKD
jgi:hypothetical protein